MPIRAADRDRYPENWDALSRFIRDERAGGRCECTGECDDQHRGGRCNARDGARVQRWKPDPAWWAEDPPMSGAWHPPITIVLTVAHLDQTPEHNDDGNLLACCQRCHLRIDRWQHGANALRTRQRRARAELEGAGQVGLFD